MCVSVCLSEAVPSLSRPPSERVRPQGLFTLGADDSVVVPPTPFLSANVIKPSEQGPVRDYTKLARNRNRDLQRPAFTFPKPGLESDSASPMKMEPVPLESTGDHAPAGRDRREQVDPECSNHGRLVDNDGGGPLCFCEDNWSGHRCQYACNRHGTLLENGACDCDAGYSSNANYPIYNGGAALRRTNITQCNMYTCTFASFNRGVTVPTTFYQTLQLSEPCGLGPRQVGR